MKIPCHMVTILVIYGFTCTSVAPLAFIPSRGSSGVPNEYLPPSWQNKRQQYQDQRQPQGYQQAPAYTYHQRKQSNQQLQNYQPQYLQQTYNNYRSQPAQSNPGYQQGYPQAAATYQQASYLANRGRTEQSRYQYPSSQTYNAPRSTYQGTPQPRYRPSANAQSYQNPRPYNQGQTYNYNQQRDSPYPPGGYYPQQQQPQRQPPPRVTSPKPTTTTQAQTTVEGAEGAAPPAPPPAAVTTPASAPILSFATISGGFKWDATPPPRAIVEEPEPHNGEVEGGNGPPARSRLTPQFTQFLNNYAMFEAYTK